MPAADKMVDAAERVVAAGMVSADVAAAADAAGETVAAPAASLVAAFSCCQHRSRS